MKGCMRMHFLMTALLAIFFILAGSACVLSRWSLAIRHLIENTRLTTFSGILFLIYGIMLLIHAIFSSKQRYYHIKSTGNAVHIDKRAIQQLLDHSFSNILPEQKVASAIILKNNAIYISANLPYFPYSEQQPLLQKIETDLAHTLRQILGYTKEFYLSVGFIHK